MSDAPLQAGDLLLDTASGCLLFLYRESAISADGVDWDVWEFRNLTEGRDSWWYTVELEDSETFRRV